MRRLLLYFSYIGSNYTGLQTTKTRIRDAKLILIPDLHSIQGILEHGLRKVLQNNEIKVINSSRTDAGVHALSTTVTFDVNDQDFKKVPFSPEKICQSLNLFLEKNQTDIRAKRVVEVPKDFFCRRAYSRTYLYSIALSNDNDLENCSSYLRLSPSLPITELNRCQAFPKPFDIHAVQNACKLFVGKWDFRSFMKFGQGSKDLDDTIFVKTIYKFSFSKRVIDDDENDEYYVRDPVYRKFEQYDFTIEGSGFLRRQVRRMVGALVSIGKGHIEPKDILHMLKMSNEKSWHPRCISVNSEGLFLKSVNYKDPVILRGYLS